MQAAAAGQVQYTSRPCRRCGCELRYTSSRACVDCTKRRSIEDGQRIRDTLRASREQQP